MSVVEEFKRLEMQNKWGEHLQMIKEKSRIYSSDVGNNSSKRPFNRCLDVKPYDRSRVKLLGLRSNDYINASLVKLPKAGRQYILAQGPLPNTISHFWLMAWEQKSSAIVMLNTLEMEVDKYEIYWPNSIGKAVRYPTVDLEVTLKSVQNLEHYCIREMLLMQSSTKQSKTIHQLHYDAFPDFNEPKSPTSFLRLISAVRKLGGLDKMDEQVIVHCTAGIGRSGVFCLVDSILYMVENQGTTEGIDIVSTLLELRDYRKDLIPCPKQLRFSYMAIIYGIKILERANMLQPHISIVKNKFPEESSNQQSTTDPGQPISKKQRRSRKKPTYPSTSSKINIFKKKHSLVEALEDIDSDSADNLVYLTTTLPTFKKARSDDTTSTDATKQVPDFAPELPKVILSIPPPTKPAAASAKFQFLITAINSLLPNYIFTTVKPPSPVLSPKATLPPLPETQDSVYLRRRQRELKNIQLAMKTMEIKNKMKAEELKRDQHAKRTAFLKKSAIVGGIIALPLSLALYVYFQNHSSP